MHPTFIARVQQMFPVHRPTGFKLVSYLSGQCSHNSPRQTLANPNCNPYYLPLTYTNHIVQSPPQKAMAYSSHTANGRTSAVCQFINSCFDTTTILYADVSLSHLPCRPQQPKMAHHRKENGRINPMDSNFLPSRWTHYSSLCAPLARQGRNPHLGG